MSLAGYRLSPLVERVTGLQIMPLFIEVFEEEHYIHL